MATKRQVTRGWIGLSAAQNREIAQEQIDVHLHGWYYLGASGSPDLVKVVKMYGDMFEYIRIYDYSHLEGKPSRIETRVGHDLIAMAQATMRKKAIQNAKYTEVWQRDSAAQIDYVLAHHDLPEEIKQDIDLTQAESEVYSSDEAKGRKSNWDYLTEDAQREQGNPERWLGARIDSVLKQGKVCKIYPLWQHDAIVFYPDGDYAWGEDRNVYPFDTEYFPVICSICNLPITENCMNGAKGTKMHYECCNKAIDDKLAAEREAKSLTPALMLSPFKITFVKPGGDLVSWIRFHTDEYDARQSVQKIIRREQGPDARVISVVPSPVTKISLAMGQLFKAAETALSVIDQLSEAGQRTSARQIVGWMNELHGLYTAAVLIDSSQDMIANWQTRAAALERQAWEVLEGKRPVKPAPAGPMIAHVYHNGKHTQLRITAEDLPELIYRSGWTVIHQIDNLTDEAKETIARIETLPYLEGQFGNDWQAALKWWKDRIISETDALTPDM